jgi:hypothetical protein
MSAAAAAVDASERSGSRAGLLQRLAALLALASVAEAAAIVLLSTSDDPRFHLDPSLVALGFLATPVAFPIMGALIVQRRPRTRVAWLMIALGLSVGFGLTSFAYGVIGYPPGPHAPLPFALAALVLSQLFFLPAIVGATTWILLLYPTDHLLGPRWRWAGWFAIGCSALYVVGTMLTPGPVDSETLPGLQNPLGVQGEFGAAMRTVGQAANALAILGPAFGALSLILRYRRADPVVAAQIRWLALVTSIAILVLAISLLPFEEEVGDLFFGLGLTLVATMPIAIGIAITRYRLYDIDRLINRALVYGSLTAILAGVFTAGVGLAQRLFVAVTHQTSDAAIVGATLVVATLYAPLRKRLESIVDRRFKFEEAKFGGYRDELTRYLNLTDPERAPLRLVEEAVDELDAIGGAVVDASNRVLAQSGVWPVEAVARVPFPHGPEGSAWIVIGPRIDGRPHDQRSLAMLADVARLTAAAIRR